MFGQRKISWEIIAPRKISLAKLFQNKIFPGLPIAHESYRHSLFFTYFGHYDIGTKGSSNGNNKKILYYVLLLMSQGFYIWHGLQINRTINRLRTSNRGTFWGWIDSQVIANSIVPSSPPKKYTICTQYSTINENKLEITNKYETNICPNVCLDSPFMHFQAVA